VYAASDAPDGIATDITTNLKPDGSIDWTASGSSYHVYVVYQHGPAMQVKRPAPGGAGNVLDPFSTQSIDDWLKRFDKPLADYHGILPSDQFHDSYEYVGDWTPDLFAQFQKLRGYDLRTELSALNGEASPEVNARVLCDYRQTMADLHMAYVEHWVAWTHAHGMTSREQAHGAPANLLDLYAVADTPETETFGDAGDLSEMPMNQFASSAAHVTGKPLASAESFTWLGDHFQVSLAQIKPVADYLFLSGLNHLIYHGIAYSPKDVKWPGWLFYAAIDFNQNGGLWHDLPNLNAYIQRCQSILQRGKPSNDILLYFPVYDVWQSTAPPPAPESRPTNTDSHLVLAKIDGKWLAGQPFKETALFLESRGYGVDFISDAQLATAQVENSKIICGDGASYQSLVVPPCKFMPPTTAENIVRLAKAGATIIVQNALPSDVPGFNDVDSRKAALATAFTGITADPAGKPQANGVGAGYVWIGNDLTHMLDLASIERETMVDIGFRFIRRQREDGYDYFIDNRTDKAIEGWVSLATPAVSAVLLNPMRPELSGLGAIAHDTSGHAKVYLQLGPWETIFVRTNNQTPLSGPAWQYWQKAGDSIPVTGNWLVHFTEGGPILPKDFITDRLESWTKLPDPQGKRFAGTADYTISLSLTSEQAKTKGWLLELGRVCDSARVMVNDVHIGPVFATPYAIIIPGAALLPGDNSIRIEVTNLATNRIADLDRSGAKWKIFNDINIVNKSYTPFTAKDWPLRDSGLLGPVLLTPLGELTPDAK
jgi:hypothetical protein